jgi:uncharacterized protein YcfL
LIFLRYILIILISLLLFGCTSKAGIEVINNCSNIYIEITEQDNIVVQDPTNPVVWEGTYNETSVKINYTRIVGTNDETETLAFVFSKKGDCLKIDNGYKYYYGSFFDVSAITEVTILELQIKDWEIDKKYTGQITYRDHHDKQIYTIKFWVEFTEDDYEIENTHYTHFSNCLNNKLPIDLDLNKDGKTDFILGYEEKINIGNNPKFTTYTIKLFSTNDDDSNLILSPKKDKSPYFIIFNPPFSSENTIRYRNGVKNTLDIFYEYEAPYESYNYFLNNNLTYSEILEDDKDDYFLIRMTISDKHYYGWIKLNFNATSCSAEVLETYLHDFANEHISVN